MTTPVEHKTESVKLTADALVDLFEVTLNAAPTPTIVCLTNGPSVFWQGRQYEGQACRLTGVSRNSEGERAKPKLQVLNPLGIYNSFVFQGYFDMARVRRRRVLRQHLVNNIALSDDQQWFIAKVSEMISNQSVVESFLCP